MTPILIFTIGFAAAIGLHLWKVRSLRAIWQAEKESAVADTRHWAWQSGHNAALQGLTNGAGNRKRLRTEFSEN